MHPIKGTNILLGGMIAAKPVPHPQKPEIRIQPLRKQKPAAFDPGSYISTEHEQVQPHVSSAYKAYTTMWSPIMESQNYQDAINDPIYGMEWELAMKEEYHESLTKNGTCELVE